MSVLQRAAILGVVALLSVVSNANAIPFTYTYVGVAFGVNEVDGGQSAGNNITGAFTIDVVSNINLTVEDQTANVVSANFSDGFRLTLLTETDITFIFGTDAVGNIILPDATFSGFPASPFSGSIFTSIPGLLLEGPAGFNSDFIRVTSVGDLTQGPGDETQGFTETPGVFTLVSEIPEPGSLALLGVGLIGFGFLRRRRR